MGSGKMEITDVDKDMFLWTWFWFLEKVKNLKSRNLSTLYSTS